MTKRPSDATWPYKESVAYMYGGVIDVRVCWGLRLCVVCVGREYVCVLGDKVCVRRLDVCVKEVGCVCVEEVRCVCLKCVCVKGCVRVCVCVKGRLGVCVCV